MPARRKSELNYDQSDCDADIYAVLVKKEVQLRKSNRGTLHRAGPKRKDRDKWIHASYNGWIQFQRCIGGVMVTLIQAKNSQEEWQLLSSFIGFLDRHFREEISGVSLHYGDE